MTQQLDFTFFFGKTNSSKSVSARKQKSHMFCSWRFLFMFATSRGLQPQNTLAQEF